MIAIPPGPSGREDAIRIDREMTGERRLFQLGATGG